jgi:hypothetical protein
MSNVGHNMAKWPADGTVTKLRYNQNDLPRSSALPKTPGFDSRRISASTMLRSTRKMTFYLSLAGLFTVKFVSGPWIG